MADDAKIERVSRAICTAQGEDPEKIVSIPSRVMGANSFSAPQWRKHVRKAEIYIAAFEAMNA